MAHLKENKKGFKIIEALNSEFRKIGFGTNVGIVCDTCGQHQQDDEKAYYVAVLNSVLCPECYNDWISSAKFYDEDKEYEDRHAKACYKALHMKQLWKKNIK